MFQWPSEWGISLPLLGALENWNGMTLSSSNTNHTTICYCPSAAKYSLKSSLCRKCAGTKNYFYVYPPISRSSHQTVTGSPCHALLLSNDTTRVGLHWEMRALTSHLRQPLTALRASKTPPIISFRVDKILWWPQDSWPFCNALPLSGQFCECDGVE